MLTKISAAEVELFEELSKTRFGAALKGLLANELTLTVEKLIAETGKDDVLRLQGECRILRRLLKEVVK